MEGRGGKTIHFARVIAFSIGGITVLPVRYGGRKRFFAADSLRNGSQAQGFTIPLHRPMKPYSTSARIRFPTKQPQE
ncbi:hypothetical protein C7212DRAFT_332662 [Tuber magnatum]|uniref:Uncharacterized protein n=1 Tax=Tuber magnatum TaxID=42249 RepID=A0A317SJG0_9PEZI|nr:hypothetical protein C7212DRAFT_332662 [Tuber magnatum]